MNRLSGSYKLLSPRKPVLWIRKRFSSKYSFEKFEVKMKNKLESNQERSKSQKRTGSESSKPFNTDQANQVNRLQNTQSRITHPRYPSQTGSIEGQRQPEQKRVAQNTQNSQRNQQSRQSQSENQSGMKHQHSQRQAQSHQQTRQPRDNHSKPQRTHQSHSQQPRDDQRQQQSTKSSQPSHTSSPQKPFTNQTPSPVQNTPPHVKDIHIVEGMTISALATAIGIRHRNLANKMSWLGFDQTQGDVVLNAETAALIALEYGLNPILPGDSVAAFDILSRPEPTEAEYEQWPLRPPVVTIMGHVDHGKTTLLDSLRKTSVAAGEAGGITQHIGAFSVTLGKETTGSDTPQKITFIDTPGHAAFSSMRKRGAQTTDIVILVVAGDDGVMPQTIEAIKHAQSTSNVKIVVAVNKCDKPGIDLDRVKGDLSNHNVVVEDYGGDIPCVPISALTGKGLDTLMETITTLSEVMDLRGDKTGPAEGIVVESQLSRGRGGVCTILVKRGTLKEGSTLVCGEAFCKVRRMTDEKGTVLKEAGPSTPVEVMGWKEIPKAGDLALECETEDAARKAISARKEKARSNISAETIELLNRTRQLGKVRMESNKIVGRMIRTAFLKNKELPDHRKMDMMLKETMDKTGAAEGVEMGQDESRKKYPVVVKADVHGSLEALEGTLTALPSHEVTLQIIDSGVGPIGESDVDRAFLAKGKVILFNLPVPKRTELYARQKNVEVISENIIYRILERVEEDMIQLLPAEEEMVVHGEAICQEVFHVTIKKKKEVIAGCKVQNGVANIQHNAKIFRGGDVVFEGKLKSLKHHKDEVAEIPKGKECGMAFEGFDQIQKDDRIQFYSLVAKKRTKL